MQDIKAYFLSSPWNSTLYLDRTLLSHGTLPLIFTLIDNSQNHFLAVCVSWKKDYEWLLTSITAKKLIDLIRDDITLVEVLNMAGSEKAYYVWPEDSHAPRFESCAQFPEHVLPEKNVYLELETEEFREYLSQLEFEQKSVEKE